MKIDVQLYATFRFGRFKAEERELEDNSTIAQVLTSLAIDEDEIGMSLVNGRHASINQGLNDGDILALFPMLGGG